VLPKADRFIRYRHVEARSEPDVNTFTRFEIARLHSLRSFGSPGKITQFSPIWCQAEFCHKTRVSRASCVAQIGLGTSLHRQRPLFWPLTSFLISAEIRDSDAGTPKASNARRIQVEVKCFTTRRSTAPVSRRTMSSAVLGQSAAFKKRSRTNSSEVGARPWEPLVARYAWRRAIAARAVCTRDTSGSLSA
jgi:hypothetical protein